VSKISSGTHIGIKEEEKEENNENNEN